MSLLDEKTADLSEVLAAIGEPVSWKGQNFRALVSEPAIGEDLNLGGFTHTGDFTIKILRSAFKNGLPQLGDPVVYESVNYRIARVTNHPVYPMIVLVVHPLD